MGYIWFREKGTPEKPGIPGMERTDLAGKEVSEVSLRDGEEQASLWVNDRGARQVSGEEEPHGNKAACDKLIEPSMVFVTSIL